MENHESYLNTYSFDASILKIKPKGVFWPKSIADIKTILHYAKNNNLSLTMRGAGTSTVAQAIGDGAIVDFSKYMNKIIKVGNDFVDVEPGISLLELNKKLAKYSLFFPVDPASSDTATIGGMLGNNSSGAHSYKYGDTIDNVLGIEGLLANGEEFSSLETLFSKENIEKIKQYIKFYPKTKKSSSFYRIDKAFKNKIDLNSLLIGSEGTLAIYTKIRLKVYQIPNAKSSVLLLFNNMEKAIESIKILEQFETISAVEFLDIEIIKNSSLLKSYKRYNAGIIVDFWANTYNLLKKDIDDLFRRLDDKIKFIKIFDNKQYKKVWNIRKEASAKLHKANEENKYSIRFIEDVALPINKILEFYRKEKEFLKKYTDVSVFFGHIASGHFHINPILKIDKNFSKNINEISEYTFSLVQSLGGVLDGEHGDGRFRVPFLKKYYPELYEISQYIKNIFDENNLLNKGVIISPLQKQTKINDYRFQKKENFDIGKNQILNLLDACNACNKCTLFCFSYKNSLDIRDKTRSRVYLLKSYLAQEHNDLSNILQCMRCGKCKYMCPSGIDIKKILRKINK